jgi:hypothetical protein
MGTQSGIADAITRTLTAEQWDNVAFWIQVALWIFGFLVFALGVAAYWAKSNSSFLKEEQKIQQAQVRNAEAAALRAQLTEADNKVADLQKRQAPRKLTDQQKQALIKALSSFRGQPISVTSVLGDTESRSYALEFAAVFAAAGWAIGPETTGQSVFAKNPIGIEVTRSKEEADAGLDLNSLIALMEVLGKLGIVDPHKVFNTPQVPRGQIHFVVGIKPQ